MNEQEPYTIDQIIEKSFDFSTYSEEEKQKTITETASMIMEASLLRSLTDSDEVTQNGFQEMIESEPSEEEMQKYITTHFPKFQETVLEELEMFLNSDDSQVLTS